MPQAVRGKLGTSVGVLRTICGLTRCSSALIVVTNMASAGQQYGAVFDAHRGGRRLGAGSPPLSVGVWGRRLVWFVVVDPVCLCGAVEPVGQHGGGGLPREPWIGAVEPERQTFTSPYPPHDEHTVR